MRFPQDVGRQPIDFVFFLLIRLLIAAYDYHESSEPTSSVLKIFFDFFYIYVQLIDLVLYINKISLKLIKKFSNLLTCAIEDYYFSLLKTFSIYFQYNKVKK